MIKAFVGMGSNRGDRRESLDRAVASLGRLPGTLLTGLSSLYETDPVGDPSLPPFLNAVARLETSLDPFSLLRHLGEIETAAGRPAGGRGGSRTLDLDLLYHGGTVLRERELEVPHPRRLERPFVLVPLAEVEGTFVDPVLGMPAVAILGERGRTACLRWVGRWGA
jgi:2-amino-4-hydroxy-6-hydroxymethyldihydropteridine diphosphokinase